MYQYFITIDSDNNVINYYNGVIDNLGPKNGDIYHMDRPERHFNLEIMNGFGEYRWKWTGSDIAEKAEGEKIEQLRQKVLSRMKKKASRLLEAATMIDKIDSVTTNFTQALTFLGNKKSQIGSETMMGGLIEIENQIDAQLSSAYNSLAGKL